MNKEDRAAIMAIFTPVLGEELAEDIIKHRIGKKCPLTPRGARSLLREYEATGSAVSAAEEHLNRGWQGFKSDWIKKPGMFADSNNPIAKAGTPQERNKRMVLQDEMRWAISEGNKPKAEAIRKQLNLLTHTIQ